MRKIALRELARRPSKVRKRRNFANRTKKMEKGPKVRQLNYHHPEFRFKVIFCRDKSSLHELTMFRIKAEEYCKLSVMGKYKVGYYKMTLYDVVLFDQLELEEETDLLFLMMNFKDRIRTIFEYKKGD